MKTNKPKLNSGKTHFTRLKRKGNKNEPGESWTELRDKAINNGTWTPPKLSA